MGPLGLDFEGLLGQWVEAGYPPADFWCETPRRLYVILSAAASTIEARRDELLWQAYHIALLSRADPIPPLDTLLSRPSSDAARQSGGVELKPADSAEEVQRRVRGWLGRRSKTA